MFAANYVESRPRTPEEIERMPNHPDVLTLAQERGVTQVVHFTTAKGAVGVLASGSLLSRARLPKEKYLEHVYEPNARIRKDVAWLDYVNLSIERINDWMFGTSTHWHAAEGNPWVVLSFDPEILAHPGVVFTTTNNIYPACKRAEGLVGFSQMFAEVVLGWYDCRHDRKDKPPEWPTDRQAEALYPFDLSCQYLQRIDVQIEETGDTIKAALDVLGQSVPVCYAPEVFQ